MSRSNAHFSLPPERDNGESLPDRGHASAGDVVGSPIPASPAPSLAPLPVLTPQEELLVGYFGELVASHEQQALLYRQALDARAHGDGPAAIQAMNRAACELAGVDRHAHRIGAGAALVFVAAFGMRPQRHAANCHFRGDSSAKEQPSPRRQVAGSSPAPRSTDKDDAA